MAQMAPNGQAATCPDCIRIASSAAKQAAQTRKFNAYKQTHPEAAHDRVYSTTWFIACRGLSPEEAARKARMMEGEDDEPLTATEVTTPVPETITAAPPQAVRPTRAEKARMAEAAYADLLDHSLRFDGLGPTRRSARRSTSWTAR